MSYPAESGLEAFGSRNSMEEAHAYLDKQHPNSYAVYNLSTRVYRSEHWFDGRVSYRPFEANRAPTLYSLLELCQNARLWLSQKPTNVCIIHCTDGRQLSAILVCSLLCFCNVFGSAQQAIDFFVSKRGPVTLTAAQTRVMAIIVVFTGRTIDVIFVPAVELGLQTLQRMPKAIIMVPTSLDLQLLFKL
ncbi:unnamed protein product [Dibothriocephalus latus]|uniref:Phosphatase tensin-type domain-containing protein n=1 Tax=Dibothriocephalus latus TaxID=60516 RepID=A0A3P7M024_DIBLA|nr:unnamed protein product [Dibothriocephalus latus]